ncbi:MAG: ABC transporter ATP-binding protein [Azospirillaceae bacterium]
MPRELEARRDADGRRSAPERPLVEAYDLFCHYPVATPLVQRLAQRGENRVVKAVDGVGFTIRRGETFALVGESGCGKSTIARMAVGLQRPTGGSFRFDGEEVAGRRRDGRIQIVFQDPARSLDPRWRVRRIIAEPMRASGARDRAAMRRRVDALLDMVGLTSADGDRYPHEFSGGQRQRISIARALADEPDFVVCDEPTSALDVSVQAQILNLMQDLQRRMGLTYLFISHDLAVVSQVADTVGVMYLGRLVETGPAEALFETPVHPYTRMLLSAVPSMDDARPANEGPPVRGEVASPIDPPAGCAFHPRCPMADDRCRRERPDLPVYADDRRRAAACHHAEPPAPAPPRGLARPGEA